MGILDRMHQRPAEGNVLPTHNDHASSAHGDTAAYPNDHAPRDGNNRFSTGNRTEVGTEPTLTPTRSPPANGRLRKRWGASEKGTSGGGVRGFFHNLTYRDGDPYGPRPTFKEWWKLYWSDFLVFIAMAILSLALLLWSPLPTGKYFTVTVQPSDGTVLNPEVYTPEFAYPKMSQHISIGLDAFVACIVPILAIVLMQFRVRSFWDVNNGIWGVVYSIMTGCMIQIIVKMVYAGLRPNFLTVCQPQVPADMLEEVGGGFRDIYFNAKICSNPDKKMVANSLQSFPSGHSTAAFAGLVFASLYLNGKLKIFGNTHQPFIALVAFCFPLLLAVCMVGTLMLDMSHNWYDILAGSILGTFTAHLAYRATYASIYDYRTNHIPLPRVIGRKDVQSGLRLADSREVGSFSQMVGIRHGGWGKHGEAWV